MPRLVKALVVVLLAAGALRADPLVRKANSVERIARFEFPFTNMADRPQDVRTCLALPQSNLRQEVFSVVPEPGYERILEDAYGNRIAVYLDKGVRPGEMRRHGWMAAVRTYAAVHERTLGVEPLREEDWARYTSDSPKYQIASPAVTALRDSLVRADMTDMDKASAVFRYLLENVKYVRDDKWDTAPEVLTKRQGSCSEYTYATISLMRACGIPCRYTGGFVLVAANKSRYDEKVHEDAVFHRWTEVFLKEYGWFPVDGSRAGGSVRRFGNYLNHWGQVPADSLQTYCGDGGDDNYVDWDYVGFAKGQVKDSLKMGGVCFFIDAPAEKFKPAIDEVEAVLAKDSRPELLAKAVKDTLSREVLFLMVNRLDRSKYPLLAEELLKVRHPSAVYFSICCDQLGVPAPGFLSFPLLVDEYLRSEILKHRSAGAWNWAIFEYWWRKARPEISFVEEKSVFILNNKSIELD